MSQSDSCLLIYSREKAKSFPLLLHLSLTLAPSSWHIASASAKEVSGIEAQLQFLTTHVFSCPLSLAKNFVNIILPPAGSFRRHISAIYETCIEINHIYIRTMIQQLHTKKNKILEGKSQAHVEQNPLVNYTLLTLEKIKRD